ncbi:MAG: hypothetical protein IT458_09440 [Planctomycetes bacterium]|nr:hypothetical protein [Planctomycetota bacterium]
MVLPRASSLLLLSVLAACASRGSNVLTDEQAQQIRAAARHRDVDAEFARRGRTLLDGFPAAFAEDSFRAGDALLFGIESWRAGRVQRTYVLLEALGRPDGAAEEVELEVVTGSRRDARTERTRIRSPRQSVRARAFDEELSELAADDTEVWRLLHEAGLFAWAHLPQSGRWWRSDEGFLKCGRLRPPPGLRAGHWGTAVGLKISHDLYANDAVVAACGRIDAMPGFGEILANLGSTLNLYWTTSFMRTVPQPIAGLPAGSKAHPCTIAGYRGRRQELVVELVVVPAVGPLALSAGVVAGTGYRTQEPDRHFLLRLLAARQGPPRG